MSDLDDFNRPILGGLYSLIAFVPIPLTVIIVYVLLKERDLRRNPSYGILARMLLFDLIQAIFHMFTGAFIAFEEFSEFPWFIEFSGCVVTIGWLISYPLICILAMYRVLVVTGRVSGDRLPFFLKIIEGLFYAIFAAHFVFCFLTRGVYLDDIYWTNDDDLLSGDISSNLEMYFGVPAMVLSYSVYSFAIFYTVRKKRLFGATIDNRHERVLFIQTSVETVYCIFLVTMWHVQDEWFPEIDIWSGFGTVAVWLFYFYLKPFFLIITNRTIRSRILSKLGIQGATFISSVRDISVKTTPGNSNISVVPRTQ